MGNNSKTAGVKDMTSGSIAGTIFIFALPVYLGNIFSSFII